MPVKTQKPGNSRGLFVAKARLKAAAAKKKKMRIEGLVSAMPKNHRPQEVGFGPARGKEAW
ncbi:MAG TPA: hypothetical protein VK914_06115 [bacterium]|jgi:hypothetical protein|nr:hypothetical protein [bacterium]